MSKELLHKLGLLMLIGMMVGGLTACGDDSGPAEEAGEEVDEAMEATGESIEEMGEDVEETAEGD